MKKTLLLFFIFILVQSTMIAQVELKANLLGALLDRPYVAIEYRFSEDLSIEVGVGSVFGKTINDRPRSGSNMLLAGKYYFNTRWGIDRYFLGPYIRPQILIIKNHQEDNFDNANRKSGIAIGFICGRKWANEKISFEVNLGIGKLYGNNTYLYPNPTNFVITDVDLDIIFNINVGYRFMEE